MREKGISGETGLPGRDGADGFDGFRGLQGEPADELNPDNLVGYSGYVELILNKLMVIGYYIVKHFQIKQFIVIPSMFRLITDSSI